jgi:hypothetical protein
MMLLGVSPDLMQQRARLELRRSLVRLVRGSRKKISHLSHLGSSFQKVFKPPSRWISAAVNHLCKQKEQKIINCVAENAQLR